MLLFILAISAIYLIFFEDYNPKHKDTGAYIHNPSPELVRAYARHKNRQGFALIAVVVIIGMIAAVVSLLGFMVAAGGGEVHIGPAVVQPSSGGEDIEWHPVNEPPQGPYQDTSEVIPGTDIKVDNDTDNDGFVDQTDPDSNNTVGGS